MALTQPTGMNHFLIMWRHYWRIEWASPERLLSFIMFGATILLVFTFAHDPELNSEIQSIYIAESFLAGFFALQLSITSSIDSEASDEVMNLLKSYPVSAESWFFAKFCFISTSGCLVLLSTLLLGAVLHYDGIHELFRWEVMGIGILSVLGMSAIGVLLSLMTFGGSNEQILYPILYYPLTCPVLISSISAARSLLIDHIGFPELLSSWLGLLIIFDIVYLTLGFMFYGMLLRAES